MTVYSHSRLTCFEQCPLKYKFRYIDEIETPRESIEAFVGKRVHEALEKLYEDLWNGRLNRCDDLLDFYAAKWDEERRHRDIRIVRPDKTEDDFFLHGLECIENFYTENFPFKQSRTVALEERVEFDLDCRGPQRFQGYVDRVAFRPDGTYEIHDYKTSRSRRTPGKSDVRQLSLYQLGLRLHPEDVEVELVFHFLSTGERLRRQQTRADLVQIVQDTRRLIDDIESERRFPAKVTRLCDWCEFREICPAFRHGRMAYRE